ncbi:hypothetical protein C8J57DRAFT_1226172 [Mycena rebaudengoi]|nr:hypothetical protein C8J57DRAFT_1226172 [Mycena rebaudengoi]
MAARRLPLAPSAHRLHLAWARRTRRRRAAHHTPPRVAALRVVSLPMWVKRRSPFAHRQCRAPSRTSSGTAAQDELAHRIARIASREEQKEKPERNTGRRKKRARTYLICRAAFAVPRRPPSAHELLHRGSVDGAQLCLLVKYYLVLLDGRRLRRARVTNSSKSSWSILEEAVRKAIGKTEIAMSKNTE